jgi:hypothetical protein
MPDSVGSLDRSRLWLLDDQRLGRKEPNMMIGVDYHPSFQQIAFLVEETGEYSERRLNHSDGEAEKYYRELKLPGVQVRVGNGSDWMFPLVRATAGRVGFRSVDPHVVADLLAAMKPIRSSNDQHIRNFSEKIRALHEKGRRNSDRKS